MNRAIILILTLCLSIPAFGVDRNDLNVYTTHVAGPEHPGDYKHPCCVEELDNGDLYVAYYCGSGEYGTDTAVWGTRLPQAEKLWTPPKVIADTPNRTEGNPVVWQAPDGLVYLFYNLAYGDTWSTARIKGKISEDGAKTWSDSFMVTTEEGTMIKGRPIVLNDGDYLIPFYYETGADREKTAEDTESCFLRYNPKTKEWSQTNRIASPTGNLQPEPVQITDDYLFCFMRRGGDFLPTETGYMLRAESNDGGRTWSKGVDTEFKNPNSAVALLKLQNDHLVLVYNDNMNDRTPLTAAISMDGGKTWPYSRDIQGGDNTFAYPYATQGKDGRIHVSYTTNNRSTVMVTTFREEAITETAGNTLE